jgi:hypothetical protein
MTNRKDDTAAISVGLVFFCFGMASIAEGSVPLVLVALALSLVAIAWGLP